MADAKTNRLDTRTLVLVRIDDKAPISSTGLIDNRLFTGESKLYAIKDPQTSMWNFKYDNGALPVELRQRFTGFQRLYKYAENYFAKRNVRIKEVLD